ncbi:MAG TPA: NADPH-dependent FMN reductase [Caulobacteraceae bacterium]|jgi:chromate reductase|nr:NADPH-dependent FMN reductase [Caulobacteraceae bacterium]
MNAFDINRDDGPQPGLRFLGLSGSLRRAAYSTAILRELGKQLPPSMSLDLLLPDLPLYNEDEDEEEALEAVRAFREKIAAADGLIICTPEYSHGIPGVLKNVLDWASRPSQKSCLKGKPALIISNSPAFTGGVRAQAQMHETLIACSAFVVPGKQVVIGGVREKIKDGVFVDKSNLSFALAEVDRLADYCRLLRAVPG